MSADPVAANARVVERLDLSFPVLSDERLTAIDAYGVIHRGMGPGGADIARPAAFLIAPDGTILWRSLTDNWRVRLDPDDVLDAIEELGP